jgi:hypothetical protein
MHLGSRPHSTPDAAKMLVAGWFSFPDGLATAGDLQAAELVRQWLISAGYPCDVAIVPPFGRGIDWQSADPAEYSHVIFVCGPFGQYPGELRFLSRFARCCLVGINLSMLIPLDQWNPFDLLFERDSSSRSRPDITFGLPAANTPVVGVCLVEAYGYPEGAVHRANSAIARLLQTREMAVVAVDTRLDSNSVGLRSPSEVEALLARMDVVITTRLHGMVLALKNGVPVVAIDPQTRGGKILRQAETIGWPLVLREDTLSDEALVRAFEYCLTTAAQGKARECAARARDAVQGVHDQFISALARGPSSEQTRNSRELVRSMASNLAADAPRSPSPDTVPACFKVVFQRARTTNWPLG